MVLSKKQMSTMKSVGKLGDRFDDDRWFTQGELPGVTKHTMDALVSKEFLTSILFTGIAYYQLIKRFEELGDES